ncbi:MAG: hypothetical protein J1E64_01475 [Acetatifactor sp.]|nr:hypothetical protein [Acetatifactor sp.]
MNIQLDNIKKIQESVSGLYKKKVIIGCVLVTVWILILIGILIAPMSESELTSKTSIGICIAFLFAILVILIFRYKKNGKYLGDSLLSLPNDVKTRMNEDCMSCPFGGNVIFCRDGLLMISDTAEAVLYSDIVFSYEHNVMGIKEIVIYDRYRRGMRGYHAVALSVNPLNLKNDPLKRTGSTQIVKEEQFFEMLMRNAPWAYYGNTQENMQKVTANFSQMVQEVDERRRKMEE